MNPQNTPTSRRNYRRWLICLLRWFLIFVLIFIAYLSISWRFGPYSTGEFRRSPDQRYEASAFNVHRRNLWGEGIHHIELKVVDLSTDKVIWEITYHHAPDADVCDYLMRDVKFVKWAEDSSSVTIPITGKMGDKDELTFRVP